MTQVPSILMNANCQVAIIMGSDSDWPKMRKAYDVLKDLDIVVHVQVLSAHRTPEDLSKFAQTCEGSQVKLIIAGAGGAAHLPGMMAAFTLIPVIGVPINTTSLNGMDSLLSIVQMPKGIPVATVAIDQAENAGILAAQILATQDVVLKNKLLEKREKMKLESRAKTKNLI